MNALSILVWRAASIEIILCLISIVTCDSTLDSKNSVSSLTWFSFSSSFVASSILSILKRFNLLLPFHKDGAYLTIFQNIKRNIAF
ncbi:hypothetical protein HN51_044362 [Arachis hypogaea]